MKTSEFDGRFDAGEDVTADLDVASARRPARNPHRVNVDFPAWMVASLDQEATRLGVTRQSVIKTWIADRIDQRPSGAHSGRVGSSQ